MGDLQLVAGDCYAEVVFQRGPARGGIGLTRCLSRRALILAAGHKKRVSGGKPMERLFLDRWISRGCVGKLVRSPEFDFSCCVAGRGEIVEIPNRLMLRLPVLRQGLYVTNKIRTALNDEAILGNTCPYRAVT